MVKIMDKTKIFPTILIILQIGAGFPYAAEGDWRKTVYWIAAAVLNITVTF